MYDKRVDDITGSIFGKLKVIQRSSKKCSRNKYYLWECLCECGNLAYIEAYKLKRGNKKSCGCIANVVKPHNFKDNREIVLWNRLYSTTILKRAKKKGYNTDISLEKFIEISKLECFYCGEFGVQQLKDNSNGNIISNTIIRFNGIDRIDSQHGYYIDNVVSCCKHCNTAKNTLSQREFESLVIKIYKHFCQNTHNS